MQKKNIIQNREYPKELKQNMQLMQLKKIPYHRNLKRFTAKQNKKRHQFCQIKKYSHEKKAKNKNKQH